MFRGDLPERVTSSSPATPKALTHQCASAHSSDKATPHQYTLGKLSSPSGFSNPPSKQSQNCPFWEELWTAKTSFPSAQVRPTRAGIPGPWAVPVLDLPGQRRHRLFHSVTTLTPNKAPLPCPWNSTCFHLCCCPIILHMRTAENSCDSSSSFPAIRAFHTLMTFSSPSLSPGSPSSLSLSSVKDAPDPFRS